jgi:hypothetical protein
MWNSKKYLTIATLSVGLGVAAVAPASAQCGYGGWGGGYGLAGYGGYGGWGGGYGGWGGGWGGWGGGYGLAGYGGWGGGWGGWGCRHHHRAGYGGYTVASLPRHYHSNYAVVYARSHHNRALYASVHGMKRHFVASMRPSIRFG